MNVLDSSFLCLDIGTAAVRGIAHRVRDARIVRSAMHTLESTDTTFAIKAVVDELEKQIGCHFDSAFVTGNLGRPEYIMALKSTKWPAAHKITPADLRAQIAQIAIPDNHYPLHIVPLRYDTPGGHNLLTPLGHVDHQLISAFGVICYPADRRAAVGTALRRAHIQAAAWFDPIFVQNFTRRAKHTTTLFIDLGANGATAAIWTDRGPVWMGHTTPGGRDITGALAAALHIDTDDAERIKRSIAAGAARDMDRFTPADAAYDFSRADVADIIMPQMTAALENLHAMCAAGIEKYHPTRIVLSGGGAEIEGIADYVTNIFDIPTELAGADATIRALGDYIWQTQMPRIRAYQARRDKWRRRAQWIRRLFGRRRRRTRVIPILPSTLAFDMRNPQTYALFRAGGISMIHVDMMDGFFVNRITGSMDELKYIRAHTNAHLSVHLMTESPAVWAADAAAAGADTIIVSGGTSGVRAAIAEIHRRGRRAGVALSPDMGVAALKPILREIDEVLIMSVKPGAGGQTFIPGTLRKIRTLAATRRKYGLKFTLSVDGGINDQTAQACWDAGADLLVAGSYLARSADFPLAVQSLLKKSE
ncbi:ribulose-phosphate 3-epimerase [bacterium]|nr:ribulose-phosphate 3-epimerase [bacterium]